LAVVEHWVGRAPPKTATQRGEPKAGNGWDKSDWGERLIYLANRWSNEVKTVMRNKGDTRYKIPGLGEDEEEEKGGCLGWIFGGKKEKTEER